MLYNLYPIDCIKGSKKYIKGSSVDLIITDPPYGISGDTLQKHYHRNEEHVIDGYVEIPQNEYPKFSLNWIKEAERILRPGGSIYIVSGYSNLVHILNALQQTKLGEVNHIIWKYNFGVYTKKKYVSSHFHILYYIKSGGKITFNTNSRYGPQEKDKNDKALNYQDREDVWIINKEYKHGQIKNKNELPEELLIKIMQYSSNEGDHVADFFLGGFSTARVAIGLNRKVTGFEINQNSFSYQTKEIKKLEPGFLLSKIKNGTGEKPKNQGKVWRKEESNHLKTRFKKIFSQVKNKKKTIEILQKEFKRGYFSILNKLDSFK